MKRLLKSKFFLIGLLVAILIVATSKSLVINKISLEFNNSPCINAEQFNRVVKLQGQNILLLSNSFINNKLTKFLCVDHVEIQKQFSDSVRIKVFGREGVVTLYNIPDLVSGDNLNLDATEATPSSSSAFEVKAQAVDKLSPSASFLVDNGGLLFAVANNIKVGQGLNVLGDLKLGDSLPRQTIIKTLSILDKLRSMNINFTQTPVIKNDWLFVRSTSDQKFYFTTQGDVMRELASLQLILQTSKINIESIDLRFSKPVVVYSKK